MKKTKVIVILVSLLAICSIVTMVALKFPYNKSNNELNSYIENITDKLPINKVDVPDESSKVDKNSNGTADPIDIVNSARKEAQQKTIYKDEYYTGGYPPEGEGVCTDVIWRGFKGYISLYTNLIKIFSSLSFNILFNSFVLRDIPKIALLKEDLPDVLATA